MASTASGTQRTAPPSEETDLPLEQRIRFRAREIWLANGGQDGAAIEDWLEAEKEILWDERK